MSSFPKGPVVDRRKYPRYRFTGPVSVHVCREGTPIELLGLCRDISEGGVAASLADGCLASSVTTLDLSLPNGPLVVAAELRYRDGQNCGFAFKDLTVGQHLQIREATEQMEPAPPR